MDDVVPSALKHLRASDIIRMAGLAAASLGQEYCRLGAVQATMRRGALLLGVIDMSKWGHGIGVNQANRSIAAEDAQPEQQRYSADIEIKSSNNWQAHCSCNPPSGTICRHVTALLYEWLARNTPGGLTGGSSVGLWYGSLGSALMVYAGLLSALQLV